MVTDEDSRRLKASRDQLRRLFAHHRNATEPETPEKQIGGDRTGEDLAAELESLED